MSSKPANVVLLFSDEHNPLFSSPYGDHRLDTPNMQWMADNGMLFRNAYCPSPLCLPCRAAFTAGRYAHDVQAYNNSNVNLSSNFESWGRALSEQNVHSVMVGKVDAFDRAEHLGWSEILVAGDRAFPGDTNQARKPLQLREGASERANQYGPHEDPYKHDDVVIENALQWLEDRASDLGKPFVLAINFLAPHFPHYTTQELWEKYASVEDMPSIGLDQATARHPRAKELRDHFETEVFSEEDVRGLRRGYYACIDYVDQQLGRLRNTLNRLELSDTTNLIYASDHGEMLGKFGMWWKCSLHEDSVRVPIIASGPDFQGGRVVETPVSLMDLQAEFFASTRVPRPDDMVGEPLQSIAENDPKRVVFSEYHGHGNSESSFMVRQGDWKLVYHINAPHQLFNLASDPDELSNLYDQEHKKAQELESELRKICDPEIENKRADEFVEAQLKHIEENNLSFALYNKDIGGNKTA